MFEIDDVSLILRQVLSDEKTNVVTVKPVYNDYPRDRKFCGRF